MPLYRPHIAEDRRVSLHFIFDECFAEAAVTGLANVEEDEDELLELELILSRTTQPPSPSMAIARMAIIKFFMNESLYLHL